MSERDVTVHASPLESGSQNSLAEFFAHGIEPNDIPQFFPLVEAKPLIGAMIALFRGGDDEVMIRLMVLREIGLRASAPEWTPRELQTHFSFINQSKLNTVLGRLREHELLLWDSERHVYQLSSNGRMVLSSLSSLLSFSSEQDGELGFLAAQIAAGAAVGKLSPEALTHLLARLAELEQEFAQAVTSGSDCRPAHLNHATRRPCADELCRFRRTHARHNAIHNGDQRNSRPLAIGRKPHKFRARRKTT